MSFAEPLCPTCGLALRLTPSDEFDGWVCPAGHGLGATLSEGYERLQEDELRRMWQLARTGAAGPCRCPMCEVPMKRVEVGYDRDEADEGTPGDTPDEGSVTVDVCLNDQLIWFDAGELEQFPLDLPDPEPTPAEQAKLAEIRQVFGQELVEAAHARPDLTDRMLRAWGRGPLGRWTRRGDNIPSA